MSECSRTSGWLTGPKHTEPHPSLPLLLTMEETLLICEKGVEPYSTFLPLLHGPELKADCASRLGNIAGDKQQL